jgi:O-antigen ligase
MSTYPKMTPAAIDDYAIFPNAVAVEPETAPPAEQRPKAVSRHRGPEFYKPFHYLLLVYLFFYCSRIPEMLPWFHIGLLLQPILLIGMFMTGTTKAMFKTDVGRWMTAFTVWVAICVPTSTWRGGSFNILILAAQALVLMFFMASFIRTLDDCYRVIYVIALAMAAVGVLSLIKGGGSRPGDLRVGLGAGSGMENTLSDANFLALYVTLGLPLLWFAYTWKKGIVKVGLLLMTVPMLATVARTGSRMGLVALAAAALFFLIFASARQRVVLIMGGFVCLVLAVMLLPQRITDRFTTLFVPSSSAEVEAAQSSEARKLMFIRSIQVTLEHPLLGVGPGEFMDAEAAEDMAVGKRGLWHYTHNAYTELSSETGIIGMVLFLFAFWRSYRGLSQFRNRFPSARVRRAALCIQMAVLVASIGAFFLSIAYSGILYPVLGLSAAFQLAAARQYKLLHEQASAPSPAGDGGLLAAGIV